MHRRAGARGLRLRPRERCGGPPLVRAPASKHSSCQLLGLGDSTPAASGCPAPGATDQGRARAAWCDRRRDRVAKGPDREGDGTLLAGRSGPGRADEPTMRANGGPAPRFPRGEVERAGAHSAADAGVRARAHGLLDALSSLTDLLRSNGSRGGVSLGLEVLTAKPLAVDSCGRLSRTALAGADGAGEMGHFESSPSGGCRRQTDGRHRSEETIPQSVPPSLPPPGALRHKRAARAVPVRRFRRPVTRRRRRRRACRPLGRARAWQCRTRHGAEPG